MARELVVELIKRKKALYQEHHELEIAELAAEEELAYCALEDEAGFKVKLREANTKQVAVKAKIDRAHFFGQRYSHSFVPSLCIACSASYG